MKTISTALIAGSFFFSISHAYAGEEGVVTQSIQGTSMVCYGNFYDSHKGKKIRCTTVAGAIDTSLTTALSDGWKVISVASDSTSAVPYAFFVLSK